jgi:ATP sulfurylase
MILCFHSTLVFLQHPYLHPSPLPQVSSRYIPNKANEAKNCYGTTSIEHPAVSMITTGTYVRTNISMTTVNFLYLTYQLLNPPLHPT